MIETSNPEIEIADQARPAAEHTVGKILVVDDEFELKNALVEALSAQSYEVRGFTNGQEALKTLRTESFDLLITDLMMPEMDGITLIKSALAIDPHLIAIMMTGQGTIQTAVDAMRFGAFDYVLKPFRLRTLMPVLTRAVNTRRLRMENLQLRETVAIYGLCQTIAFTLDSQTVLSKLADAALQQSDADEVSVLLPTEDGKELVVAAVRGAERARLLGERIPLDQSIASWVARERVPLLLNGEVQDDRFVALWPRADIRSAVSVPMQVANKLVGIVNLNMTNRVRPFTLGQMKALTILASTAAAALESASLHSQVLAAEKRYRSIFENATEGLFQSSPEGRLLTANPEFARILGYASPEEAIHSITDVSRQLYANPKDRLEAARRQTESRVLVGFEMEALRKDGEKIWVNVNRRAVYSEAGEVLFFEGSFVNITERKRAEQLQAQLNAKIREQGERIDTIVGSVPGIVFESWSDPSTRESRTDFVSDYIETMLGYTVSEWLATPGFWLKVVHPDDRQRVKREADSQFRGGSKGEFEFRWLGKDKRIVWVRAHTIIIRDEQGKSIGVRGVVTDITAGKQAEKALRESEERYRELVENADDLIYEHDLKGNYTACNRTGKNLTGYTLEETLKLSLLDTVAPEYLDRAKEMLRRKLTGEKVTAYELLVITKDGRRVPVEVNTRLVLKEGVPVGVQGIARDITERKRVEEIQARRETHALFRADISAALAVSRASLKETLASCAQTMVHHLGAAFARIWTLNHDKQVLELQASAGLYTHLDGPQALVPMGSFKIGKIALERTPHITNDVLNDERVSDKKWARTEGMIAFAGYPLAVDDRVVGVMAMFSREELADDTLDALASVADLISQAIERKRAEEALGESEERYRLLFESNPQPMWVYDLETLAFLAVNQSAVIDYGYSLTEFLSMTIKDIRPPGDWPALHGAVAAVSKGPSKDGAWRHLKKDGSLIDVEITAHPLVFDGRRAELILANDITERKRLEAALMASEAQLRQSQKLEAIGQLAGGVAHDFNNLLTVIGGYSSILLNKLPPESPHRSNVEEIKKAGDRAGALTRQLLAFSRKQILQPKILDLNVAVADMEKMVRRLIGEDINMLIIATPTLGKVKADPGQIEQVLINLIVNARDAMPQGGKLTVQTSNVILSTEHAERHEIEPGRYVMLAVSDNGCGMDQEIQNRIFDPFFTTKDSGKGTGLGLATVYGIVKQSGGNIWVYSESGKGSTFKIYLPRVDEIAEEEEESISQPLPKGTETVLMVEDEDQVRAILQHILEEQGYHVIAAANGLEALSFSEDPERDIQLVITDVVMPNMSGRELAERLLEVRPNLPVLFMSGYTDDAIVHHGLLDEKLNFIQKPFDPAGVARKVREVLDSPKSNQGR